MTRRFALGLLVVAGITGSSISTQRAQAAEPLSIKFDGPAPGSDQPQTSPDSPEASKLRVNGTYTLPQGATVKGVVVRYRVKGKKSWDVLDAKLGDKGTWTASKINLQAAVYEVQARILVTLPDDKGDREVYADRDGPREVTIR